MPQKAIIKLQKVDSETNRALTDAVYEIYANEDISVNGDLKYHRNALVDTITTDANGEAYSDKLYLGQYRIVEKTAPHGYVLDTDEHIANLEYQGQEVVVFTEGYTAENAPQKAKIELLKIDKETRQPIANAVYDVYAKSDVVLNGDVKYPANSLVDTVTTDGEGKALTKSLYLGEYSLVETTAPYGYVLNSDKIDVVLEYRGQNVPEYTASVTAENMPQKGIITVTKTGESFVTVTESDDIYTPNYADKGLQGAVFNIVAVEDVYTADGTLRASNGEVLIQSQPTKKALRKAKNSTSANIKLKRLKRPTVWSLTLHLNMQL